MKKSAILTAGLLVLLSGCSATSLRCGITDGGTSYVDLVNVPQDLSTQTTRDFADLCGFAYEPAEAE